MNPSHYLYRVVWSEEDGEFVGLCAEFPGLSGLAGRQADALAGIVELVTAAVKDLQDNNEPVPEPLSSRTFSGRFQVRIPPERHRALAMQAAESGVSLNRYVSDRLAAT